MTALDRPVQGHTRDSGIVALAGRRIDVVQYDPLGVAEDSGEVLQQPIGTGEGVRHEVDDERPVPEEMAQPGQGHPDLRGVVAVVLDEGNAARVADHLAAPARARKPGQRP